MKTYSLILFLIVFGFKSPANPVVKPAPGSSPTAYLSFATYTTAKGDHYIETYISVVGRTFNFVKTHNNTYGGKTHVRIWFKQGDSTYLHDNFVITSPEVSDTTHIPNFSNTERYWLKPGKYTMVFSFDDPNDTSSKKQKVIASQAVNLSYPSDNIAISDAELLDSYSHTNKQGISIKCGYNLVPNIGNFYPVGKHDLSFYLEIYNAVMLFGLDEKFLVRYTIQSADNRVSPSGFIGNSILQADTVNPIMAKMDISNLPTGNYKLAISVIDKNNHTVAQKYFGFTRLNSSVIQNTIPGAFEPYMATRDTMIESIRCLYPIANGPERFYVNSDSLPFVNMAELRNFFYNFWLARDTVHPFGAWQKYLGDVLGVNYSFGLPGIKKGYKTDRGRVYLEYGPPNQRTTSQINPTSYPYEIWQYYTLPDGQVNKKFVFYMPNPSTNNYILLHSDAIGEIQNPRWEMVINSILGQPSNVDQMKPDPTMGERSSDFYQNPR